MPESTPWRCDGCGSPIGDGAILVFNANPSLGEVGSHPVAASPDAPADRSSDAARIERDPSVATLSEQLDQQVEDALWLVDRPVNVDFAALCRGCDTFSAMGAYQVPALSSSVAWLAWIVHLNEKTWMGAWDLHRMARFWFSNRGLDPAHFLR